MLWTGNRGSISLGNVEAPFVEKKGHMITMELPYRYLSACVAHVQRYVNRCAIIKLDVIVMYFNFQYIELQGFPALCPQVLVIVAPSATYFHYSSLQNCFKRYIVIFKHMIFIICNLSLCVQTMYF